MSITENMLDTRPKTQLKLWLDFAEVICPKLDREQFESAARENVRHWQMPKWAHKARHRPLEDRWYASLDTWDPDYSVYSDPDFLPELWGCWAFYSRRYLRDLRRLWGDTLSTFEYVVDLGCGIGMTTAALTELCPRADVFGSDLLSSPQWMFAAALGNRVGFTMVGDAFLTELNPERLPDMVFASEYFEHFESPIDHLRDVLALDPTYLVMANAFTGRAIGHFNAYRDGDEWVAPRKISKRFRDHLRSEGYEPVDLGVWNNRPEVWSR
jgi:SAM-dependent methyltransferase